MDKNVFKSSVMDLKPEWIDYNGHLNMAYYHVVFDKGVDEFLPHIGLDIETIRKSGVSAYTVEVHVCYLHEIHPQERVYSLLQILDFDEKRLHFMQELYDEQKGVLRATSENMLLHVDTKKGKASPFLPQSIEAITQISQQHAQCEISPYVGRLIGIKKKNS